MPEPHLVTELERNKLHRSLSNQLVGSNKITIQNVKRKKKQMVIQVFVYTASSA